MKELANRLTEKIKHEKHDSIVFDTDKKSVEIKKENFNDIEKSDTNDKLIFVDGGNLEVIRSPSLSLFFNRIYYTMYKANRRIKSKKYEFFTLIYAQNKEGKLIYKTENYFAGEKFGLSEYEFESFDKTLTRGNRRVKISTIGNVLRRFAELVLATEIREDGLIILDGSLEHQYTHEATLIKKLVEKKTICGISKTTEVLTKSGDSISAYLRQMTDKDKWYYNVGKDNLYFGKLHSNSDYVFKIELNKKNKIDDVMYLLSLNSRDPIFLGYPYGLIEADRFARVSNKEREDLQLQLKFLLKKDFEKVKPYLNSVNAHEILDSIS